MNFVDQFFLELDKRINQRIKIILTGAMAGIILGNIRPSMDIDFEIEFSPVGNPSEKLIQDTEFAIQETSKKLNMPSQYSESIQGWSQISFLDYREFSTLYKQIGKIEVRIMSPEHWSIGKMARYLELDEMDVTYVFKKHKIDWEKIVAFWGRALKNSIRSDKSREFRDHVMQFLKHKGKKIWGDNFNPDIAIDKFKKSGIS
jgi:hypothetical protein